jgi:hypothetical protein
MTTAKQAIEKVAPHTVTDSERRAVVIAPVGHLYCYIHRGDGRWYNVGLHMVTDAEADTALCQRIADQYLGGNIHESDAGYCGNHAADMVVFLRTARSHSNWASDFKVYSTNCRIYRAAPQPVQQLNAKKTFRVYSMSLGAGAYRGTAVIVDASDLRFPVDRNEWPGRFLHVNQDEEILETFTRAAATAMTTIYNNENATRTIIVLND